MYTNMYKYNISVHIILYTCIHMVYIKSLESKGTLVLSIVRKLGRMESLTVRVVAWSHAHLYVHTYIHKQIHNLDTYICTVPVVGNLLLLHHVLSAKIEKAS